VRAPQNAQLLTKRSDRLTACLVAMLHMCDRVAFHVGIDAENFTSLKEVAYAVVRLSLSQRPGILPVVSYGHHPPLLAAVSGGDQERKL
jgi:hypothetical protein